MADSNNASSSVQVGPGLIGFCTLITIVLAVLKLIDVLAISWFIVFLPLIIGGGVTVAILVLSLILFIIIALVASK